MKTIKQSTLNDLILSPNKFNLDEYVIKEIDLANTDLIGFDANYAVFISCNFQNIDFSSSWFLGSVFVRCKFSACRLTDCAFNFATIRQSIFNKCFFGKSEMYSVQIHKSRFEACDFRLVSINDSIITDSYFSFAMWPGFMELNPKPELYNVHQLNLVLESD